MTTKQLDGNGSHWHARCGLPSLLLAISAGTAWAGDEAATAEPERVEAVVEEAAAEADEGRTDPQESWFTGSPTAESAPGDRAGDGGDRDLPEHKAEAMDEMDGVVDGAAAEADDGRTDPKESWLAGSTTAESAPGDHAVDAGDRDLPEHKAEAMDKVDGVVDDAAAEADDGRTDPKESWLAGSTDEDAAASAD